MKFKLTRVTVTGDGVFGVLVDAATHKPICVTLEDPADFVKPGTYVFARYRSPKRGYVVWNTNDPDGRTYIQIHIGNTKLDTEGCILLGQTFGRVFDLDAVLGSTRAFRRFMELTADRSEIEVEIK